MAEEGGEGEQEDLVSGDGVEEHEDEVMHQGNGE